MYVYDHCCPPSHAIKWNGTLLSRPCALNERFKTSCSLATSSARIWKREQNQCVITNSTDLRKKVRHLDRALACSFAILEQQWLCIGAARHDLKMIKSSEGTHVCNGQDTAWLSLPVQACTQWHPGNHHPIIQASCCPHHKRQSASFALPQSNSPLQRILWSQDLSSSLCSQSFQTARQRHEYITS